MFIIFEKVINNLYEIVVKQPHIIRNIFVDVNDNRELSFKVPSKIKNELLDSNCVLDEVYHHIYLSNQQTRTLVFRK